MATASGLKETIGFLKLAYWSQREIDAYNENAFNSAADKRTAKIIGSDFVHVLISTVQKRLKEMITRKAVRI